jgi:peroxiredoxin
MMTTGASYRRNRGFILGCILVFSALPVIAGGPGIFTTAPRFTARDINNRLVSVDSLIAHGTLIIDFWATWCVPCMNEFRAIEKLMKKYGDSTLTVLAICEDGPSELAKVKQMAASKKWPFTIIMDNGKNIAQKFNVNALPTMFLIGSDGAIRLRTQGFVAGDEAKLEEQLRTRPADENAFAAGSGSAHWILRSLPRC